MANTQIGHLDQFIRGYRNPLSGKDYYAVERLAARATFGEGMIFNVFSVRTREYRIRKSYYRALL